MTLTTSLIRLLTVFAIVSAGSVYAQSQSILGVDHYKHVALVIDASGSMQDERLDDGRLNWALAKNHVSELLKEIGRDTQTPVAIVNFGEDQPSFGVCTQEVTHRLSTGNSRQAERIISDISRWIPNGKTALSAGLELAWKELDATGGMIVVFTDLEQDNCGGDPCETVTRLQRQRDPSKPAIDLRFVVPIGKTGLVEARRIADCSGAETLPANNEPDIIVNVAAIMNPLREPEEAVVKFVMRALDPAKLGVKLPPQSSAVLSTGGGQRIALAFDTEKKVKGANAQITVNVPDAAPMNLGPFKTVKGLKTTVLAYNTPPLLDLTLTPSAASAPDIKWVLTQQGTQKQMLFSGPNVLQFVPAGRYDIEVFAGELHITGSLMAQWNMVVEQQFKP